MFQQQHSKLSQVVLYDVRQYKDITEPLLDFVNIALGLKKDWIKFVPAILESFNVK